MLKKEKNKTWQSFALSAAVIVLVGLSVLLIFTNLKIARKRKELGNQLNDLKAKMEQFDQEKSLLESKIFQTNDEDYLEKIARDELNLQMPGEKVVVFPIIEGEEPEEQTSSDIWQKLWENEQNKTQ